MSLEIQMVAFVRIHEFPDVGSDSWRTLVPGKDRLEQHDNDPERVREPLRWLVP